MLPLALFWAFLFFLLFVSVPLALVLAVIAFHTAKQTQRQLQQLIWSHPADQSFSQPQSAGISMMQSPPPLRPHASAAQATENVSTAPAAAVPSSAATSTEQPAQPANTVETLLDIPPHIRLNTSEIPATASAEPDAQKSLPLILPTKDQSDLEWTLAGKVGLFIGAVLALMGAGYFVKYVYEHMLFGPWLRVSMVAVSGAAAWLLGHLLRQKQFALSAKVMTALGFGLLFTAVLSAHNVYALFDRLPALALAGMVTALALGYAVVQKDRILGLLALSGGFLSAPILFSAQALTMPVFGYLLILAIGGVAASHWTQVVLYRWLSALGVYSVLTVWLFSFPDSHPKSLLMLWLGIFVALFWFAALWHSIWRKVASLGQDIGLLLFNDAAWLYCLWKILPTDTHRALLATWLAAGGVIHFILYAAVRWRCPANRSMIFALTLAGLFMINVAAAIYFTSMNLKIILWTSQAALLTLAACRWKMSWSGWAAVFLMIAAACWLVETLPLHKTISFRFIFNPSFGIWIWTAAMAAACALFCRFARADGIDLPRFWMPFFHLLSVGITGAACFLEWYAYCRWQIGYDSLRQTFWIGGGLISAAVIAALWLRPLPPARDSVWAFGLLTTLAGSIYGCWVIAHTRSEPFVTFFNPIFGSVFLIIAIIAISAYQQTRRRDFPSAAGWRFAAGIVALLTLWAAGSLEVWRYFQSSGKPEWDFWASMVISIGWAGYGLALIIAGFVGRSQPIRYMALTVFAVLVLKLGLVDIQYLPAEYRIAAFLTGGVTLLAVGIWYQTVRKIKSHSRFFDKIE